MAALVMITRISIKVRLAWSTVVQIGPMLVECALGLYELALWRHTGSLQHDTYRMVRRQGAHLDHAVFDTPSAGFGLVEMLGIFKSISMLKNSLKPAVPGHPVNQLCDDRPFVLTQQGQTLSVTTLTELAATVLTHMGLTENVAPVVLLLGHSCETANNAAFVVAPRSMTQKIDLQGRSFLHD
ncbi:hypothetical protein PS2015_378 [Pseudohongiella spirulinae]|uniref:Uncharacterized protein n=1 Tax=Pseudohongiella spirulinae TaxID=1249552 RepID=A0A0S2K9N1_9GAMM|nr:hypothetical protein PS2015_378 [Pseudohongiella spirulinae]